MPVLIDGPPLADFTKPLDVLRDCHRRIERFLGVFLALTAAPIDSTLDERQRSALALAIRYFDRGLPLHTADEERSLFPRLSAASHGRTESARGLLAQLESEHRETERRHRIVHEQATKWLREGSLTNLEAKSLRGEIQELERMYRTHVQTEELEVFPLAANILGHDEIRALALEMKRRRSDLAFDWAWYGERC